MNSLYLQLISFDHLLQSWQEFEEGKKNKWDVQRFERNLEDNLFCLHKELQTKTYKHAGYIAFNIYDPKFRHINKATVRDRVIHHAVVSIIEPFFDKIFISDSYSCRVGKGTHRAVKRLAFFARKVSKNYTAPCFALKLDIKKFFESVDHEILLHLIQKRIHDPDLLWLIQSIVKSFREEKGIPIGNLTSQIFANIYLNELDQYIKHTLRLKHYLRYCDDFIILSENKGTLENLLPQISLFLQEKLALTIHEKKIVLRKLRQGIDFLGYIVLPYNITLPRTKTRRRLITKLQQKTQDLKEEKITKESFNQTLQSYLGYLKHADSYKLTQQLKNDAWFWLNTNEHV